MRTVIPLFFLMAGACSPGADDPNQLGGGQFGEETGSGCVVDTETPLAGDASSVLGFTPDEMLSVVASEEVGTLVWADGSDTEYTLGVVPGDARYVELIVDSGSGGIEPALGCDPYVAVDATIQLSTADGQLDETWSGELRRGSPGDVTWTGELDALEGTLDLWDAVDDPSGFSEIRGWVDIRFDEAGSHGAIEAQASGEDGELAYAELFEVGSWPMEDQL